MYSPYILYILHPSTCLVVMICDQKWHPGTEPMDHGWQSRPIIEPMYQWYMRMTMNSYRNKIFQGRQTDRQTNPSREFRSEYYTRNTTALSGNPRNTYIIHISHNDASTTVPLPYNNKQRLSKRGISSISFPCSAAIALSLSCQTSFVQTSSC